MLSVYWYGWCFAEALLKEIVQLEARGFLFVNDFDFRLPTDALPYHVALDQREAAVRKNWDNWQRYWPAYEDKVARRDFALRFERPQAFRR